MTDPLPSALPAIWSDLGADPAALDRVAMSGPEAALPSAFRVTELAAGCVGAATLAAAELGALDGRRPEVTVDRRHAALGFRSERHITVDGSPPPSPWDAASGYYTTADGGLVQTHCNFPHHRAGVLAELGIDDPGDDAVHDALAAAISERGAQELEDRLYERGMVASMLRTSDEWAAHPHGVAVRELPLIEILPLGDAPAEPLPVDMPGVAGGVRVVDLTRVMAGPVCTRTLAAYGADVLRIGAPHLPVVGPVLADTNLGKRWTDLDLRQSVDAAALSTLVGEADVVVQGYRPGGLDKLGFSPAQMAERRPGLVVASLSAYSHVGPWAEKRGFDSLVQTATGIGAAGAAAAGEPGTKPLPAQAHDHGAGWLLAAGVMEALRRRATVGGSWLVRTSLVQVRTFLGDLGSVGDLAVPDPGDDIADLLVATGGPGGRVGHIALPGRLDGALTTWRRSGTPAPTDPAEWLDRGAA